MRPVEAAAFTDQQPVSYPTIRGRLKMNEPKVEYAGGKNEHDHPEKKVEITVDGKKREIRPGTYELSEFKKLIHVDASRDLDQIVNNEPVPVQGTVTITGGEIFLSHVPQGG